ncbi:hypothetical protein [Streptomyces sp. NBC_00076]|uniref:hypothetical protein n=1 Tax=Streptomyces sp. NBC_00076 TaxID=2975642 RepID=UPI00325587CB
MLLETAQARELHLVAGQTNFSVWVVGVLGVQPKYVFELLNDAARIRVLDGLAQQLGKVGEPVVQAGVVVDDRHELFSELPAAAQQLPANEWRLRGWAS